MTTPVHPKRKELAFEYKSENGKRHDFSLSYLPDMIHLIVSGGAITLLKDNPYSTGVFLKVEDITARENVSARYNDEVFMVAKLDIGSLAKKESDLLPVEIMARQKLLGEIKVVLQRIFVNEFPELASGIRSEISVRQPCFTAGD